MSKDESSKKLKASSFPYEVDYNDHFETPIEAYEDILPLLDLVAPVKDAGTNKQDKCALGQTDSKQAKQLPRSEHVIYDPYYCDGRVARLLKKLGFHKVQHKKCDFYENIRRGDVPVHHTLVTNPPYSGNHKEKCVEYAVKSLRQEGRPFFLLMPNYVALKEYFRHAIADEEGKEPKDIVYVIPPASYQYDHPEGTGHDIPPFASIWFCGLGSAGSEQAKTIFDRLHSKGKGTKSAAKRPPPVLVSTLEELKKRGAVPNTKRMNPKQRRKQRQKFQKALEENSDNMTMIKSSASPSKDSCVGKSTVPYKAQQKKNKKRQREACQSDPKKTNIGSADRSPSSSKSKKKSIYRDVDGVRKKRRF